MKKYSSPDFILQRAKMEKAMRNKEEDPTEELGCQLSPSERVVRVLQEIKGVSAQFNITSWERDFLRNNTDSTWPKFTEKQEAAMQRIEMKVFGEAPSAVMQDDRKSSYTEDKYKELDGQLKFHKKIG